MNENTKLSSLSYKELQALALKYKVPGNIRKNILIKVLGAVKDGNDLEVRKILRELNQNRKKRSKKANKEVEEAVHFESTLAHDTNYQETHSSRKSHQGSCDWVIGGENFGVIRGPTCEENRVPIPSYGEFQQFLLEGIPREYCRHSDTIGNTNERSQSPAVDLRINSDRIDGKDEVMKVLDGNSSRNTFSQEFILPNFDYKDVDINNSDQYKSPRLLKKMLQAPAGVNLKQLASYDNLYNIPPTINNTFDDSDTLTANSDDNIDGNHTNGDDNKHKNDNANVIEEAGSYPVDHYQSDCNPVPYDIIRNCQKWLDNSSPVGDKFSNYNNSSNRCNNNGNSTNNVNCNISDNKAITDNINDNNHNAIEVVNSHYNYSQNVYMKNNGNNFNNSNYSTFYCHSDVNNQQCDFNINDDHLNQYQHHYHQFEVCGVDDIGQLRSNCNNDTNFNIIAPQSDYHEWTSDYTTQLIRPLRVPSLYQNREPTLHDVNNRYYEDYRDNTQTQKHGDFELENQHQESHQQYLHYSKCNYDEKREEFDTVMIDCIGDSKVSNELTTTDNCVLNSYWPQWISADNPKIQTSEAAFRLENLLNLKNACRADEAKLNQTACVYCYAAPVVTERIFSSLTCSQEKSLLSEIREPSLTTYCLLYGDIKSTAGSLTSFIVESTDYQKTLDFKDATVVANVYPYSGNTVYADTTDAQTTSSHT